jgi:hypothetical protein
MSELTLDRDYRRGDRGAKVRLIQEWLTLNDVAVVSDGKFGAATEAAIIAFQRKRRLTATGVATPQMFQLLVEPMKAALVPIPSKSNLGATVVAYAKQHLKSHPREVGGENKGPWVRLYMNGNEGAEFPWCAGFACFVLRQACGAHGVGLPITPSVSCDSLAASAKNNRLFVREADADQSVVKPGSLFLNRRTPEDWTHVGIVTSASPEFFATVEGNTNDEGSREGFEVCARTRGYASKDFVVLSTGTA